MTECTNLEMRDLLPDYARGALVGAAVAAVERHLADCASCRAELAVVRNAQLVLGVAPRVDVSRIAAAVVRSAAIRRGATTAVAQARRRRAWTSAPSRRMWLAAASLVAVVGAAVLATRGDQPGSVAGAPPRIVVQVDSPSRSAPSGTAPSAPVQPAVQPTRNNELSVGGGLTDLADAELESLLRELEGLDAQFEVEPANLLPVLEGDV